MASLHRLRSALARVQGEIELLELDGAQISDLRQGLVDAFAVLEKLEESSAVAPVAVVLEDEERLGALTVRALCRHGVPAVLALALEPALRLAAAGAVLVADLSALAADPDVDVNAIRSSQPIVVSGAASADARTRADGLGAFAYFLKPVDIADLAAAIRSRRAAAES